MAIAFRALTQAASGGSSGASTISAPALPATGGTTVAGDLVLLLVEVKYASVTMTAPSGWTVVSNNEANNTGLTDSGNDAGNVRAAIFFREYDGVWAMPSITLSGGADVTLRGAISYSKGASEAWVTPVCASAVDNTGATTGLDPAASGTTLSFGTGDWFGSYGALNGDAGTFSSHTFTVSGVTFGTGNIRLSAVSTTGTDARVHSQDKSYTSGTASAGPDGAVNMTSAASTCAGVMIFYRLRVGTTVAATMVSACGALTATTSATVVPRIEATLVAPLGGLTATASATVIPRIEAALIAPLGGLSATAAATRTLPATLTSSCGGLTATMSATVDSGTTQVNAVLAAPLGGLTAAATAVVQHPVTLSASCGGLVATAAATVQHSALGTAPLGTLTATMSATVITPPVVDAVLVADLGALVAMANAGPPPPPIASVGFERFAGPSPAWGEVVSWVDAINEGNYR